MADATEKLSWPKSIFKDMIDGRFSSEEMRGIQRKANAPV
jgi:hypothetical protein